MALFNHLFPYSNLHDINLDWIISIIKSIDPAVIKALQELTPDIVEQVTQKVAEAQAAAIAAQSSASEANTAKENATASAEEATQQAIEASADAALANADAARAENAKTAVEQSLDLSTGSLVAGSNVTLYGNFAINSGKTVIVHALIGITGDLSGTTTLFTISNMPLPASGLNLSPLRSVDNNTSFMGGTLNSDGTVTTTESLSAGTTVMVDVTYVSV